MRPPQPLAAGRLGVQPQGMEPQGMEPQGMEPQGIEPQGMEPQGADFLRAGCAWSGGGLRVAHRVGLLLGWGLLMSAVGAPVPVVSNPWPCGPVPLFKPTAGR